MNRRTVVIGCVAAPILGLGVNYSKAESDATSLDKAVRNQFGYRSTAEEVTAGIDLSGKTALVTGCNAGIGFETMRVLVMRGANVLGLARSIEKASQACNAVATRGKGRAIPFVCEQTDFGSVVACAEAVKRQDSPIDILICNAGIYALPELELAHGLEKQFVVNHLSHFILVNRLLGKVAAAKQGRIVVVGSSAYNLAPAEGIDFDNLAGQKYYDPDKHYGQSKLANGLFARELAQRLNHSNTTANVLDPGWVMTETMRKLVKIWNTDAEEMKKAKTPEQGAATSCYVGAHPSVAGISGEYFQDCNVVVPGGHMRDDAMAQKLWHVSEGLTADYLR